jgi:type IV fimbrial biogenesis protein FimU
MLRAKTKRARTSARAPSFSRGFTLIEVLVAIGILGIMMAFALPSFTHTQTVRALDNEARTILMALQTAKWQAVSTKLNHRLLFVSTGGGWTYRVERESASGTWTLLPGTTSKGISSSFGVTLTLPSSLTVVFQPTGLILNYESAKNSIVLSSAKLQNLGQPGLRTIRLFAGGSFRYMKS